MDKFEQVLTDGWKFHRGECEGAWYKGMDDSDFKDVLLPHDWSVEYPFSEEYASGTGYLPGGIGWYRLHFRIPEILRGMRISLVFDGIYKNSQVWFNSYYFGKRPNGYIGFSYDISQMARFGEEENVVSIKVSHPDIADSRWFTGSGITRKVKLMAQEWVYPMENGVDLRTLRLEGRDAKLLISHEIVNGTEQPQELQVETVLVAEDGTEALCEAQKVCLSAGEKRVYRWETTLRCPVLWSITRPALYRMYSYYRFKDGRGYLADERRIGIRTIRFDIDSGFYLNDNPLKIKGVCVHHDAGCLGAAVTKEIWLRRLEKLKDCGCNAIRCSHNPHMPELYELCDEMGFLVMDEAFDEWENAKNKWTRGHNVYPPKHQGYAEDFPEWHERDLRAMVRRDRFHPSVILWSIGNEIDYPNDPYCHPAFLSMTGNNDANKPAAEREYNPDKPDAGRMLSIAQKLSKIVREEDDTRPVTMALAFPELSARLGIFSSLDIAGYNYKEHLYEKDHAAYPRIPFFGSENGHSFEAWKAVVEHTYISGQFLWTGIDYLGEAHGWPVHGSAAGLLDCAGYEKMQFYRRASFWKDEPVITLAVMPRSEAGKAEVLGEAVWDSMPEKEVCVACYTNLPHVDLLLNGNSVGKAGYRKDGVWWFDITYEPGELVAIGYNENGEERKRAMLRNAGKAERLRASIWEPKSAGILQERTVKGMIGYIYQIEITLLDDREGIAKEEQLICTKIKGAGMLAGMENGDLSDNTSYTAGARKTRGGRLLVYIKRTGVGSIQAEFWSGGGGNQ